MEVKIVKQSETKITLQIDLELDSNSMLASENLIQQALNQAGLAATKLALEQFDTDGSPIDVGGEKMTSKGAKKKIQSSYGVIELSRHIYQNQKGGKIYIPLEVDARIIGQTTPKFAQQISSKYGDLGARKVQKDLLDNHGRKISRHYIQDISSAVGQLIGAQEAQWEYTLPAVALQAKTISLGMDGTTAYLVEDGYRETMSGTISFFDEQGQRVHTIYVAQTPEYGKATFKERFTREIALVKSLCPTAHYAGIADGAGDNWSFLTSKVDTAILDFWHANEYLNSVSKIVSKSQYEQKQWLKAARHWLRYRQSGAQELLEDMKSLRKKRVSKTKKEQLETSITYFSNHWHQMNYAEWAEKGLPIGSGVTEAACKVIVKERLCCSGMMWKELGAQSVLNIRCLTHTEQRWSQFWDFFDIQGMLN